MEAENGVRGLQAKEGQCLREKGIKNSFFVRAQKGAGFSTP